MENFIAIILWLGIGFLSTIKLESEAVWGSIQKANSNSEGATAFVRFCWIIFWPVTLIVYILTGPKTK